MKNITLSGNSLPKQKLFADIFSSLLLIFFIHTTISTYVNFSTLESLLGFYTSHTLTVAWIIIIVEFLISLLLLIPQTRTVGLVLSILFALTAIFTIVRTPHYPHDFGGMLNDISRTQKFLAYGCIILVAILGIILSFKKATSQNQEESQPVVFT